MSDKAKPLTPEQRVIHEKHFQVYEVCGITKPVPKAYHIKVMRRYEATVRQLEAGLAAVTAERNAALARVASLGQQIKRNGVEIGYLHDEVRGLMEQVDLVTP